MLILEQCKIIVNTKSNMKEYRIISLIITIITITTTKTTTKIIIIGITIKINTTIVEWVII